MDLQSTRSIAKLSIVRLTVQPAAPRDVLPTIKYFTSLRLSFDVRALQLAAERPPGYTWLKPVGSRWGNNVARLDLTPANAARFSSLPRLAGTVGDLGTLALGSCLAWSTDKDLRPRKGIESPMSPIRRTLHRGTLRRRAQKRSVRVIISLTKAHEKVSFVLDIPVARECASLHDSSEMRSKFPTNPMHTQNAPAGPCFWLYRRISYS